MADSVYWINTDYTESSIRCAPLDGSGPVGTVDAGPGDGLNFPLGMALDPAAGRIYWTSNGDDKISVPRLTAAARPPSITVRTRRTGWTIRLG